MKASKRTRYTYGIEQMVISFVMWLTRKHHIIQLWKLVHILWFVFSSCVILHGTTLFIFTACSRFYHTQLYWRHQKKRWANNGEKEKNTKLTNTHTHVLLAITNVERGDGRYLSLVLGGGVVVAIRSFWFELI